jgi:CBS domain-containing protein
MKLIVVMPRDAAERVAPLIHDAGWRAVPPPEREADDRGAMLDVVRRGDWVVWVPDRAEPAASLGRIIVVHEGSRGDRAGMEAADDAAVASGAEIVVVHLPGRASNPTPGSLSFRIADHGEYDMNEWREEFLRRFCRGSTGVRVTLRVGAGSPALLRDQVRSESPDLVIVSGPPEAGTGEEAFDAVVDGDVPVLIVPSVGRSRWAQADAERGQPKGGRVGRNPRNPVVRVRDVMTTPVVFVGPATPLHEVARALVDNHISGVPVVSEDGAVVGVVTEADLVLKGQGSPATVSERRFAWLLGEAPETRTQPDKPAATNAREAMSAPVITTGPDQLIADAARTMTERRVNRLPVVENDRLVGILTRADIVRTYLRSDADVSVRTRDAASPFGTR